MYDIKHVCSYFICNVSADSFFCLFFLVVLNAGLVPM